ncbi:MAG: hypothetical protein RSB70_04035 [Clostridium sp.]
MGKTLLITSLTIVLSTGLMACNKNKIVPDNNSNVLVKDKVEVKENSMVEEKGEVKDNIKSQNNVKEELKLILINSTKEYFDINIDEKSMDYSMGEEFEDNKFRVIDNFKNLNEVYVRATAKDNSVEVVEVIMKYDTLNKVVEYMDLSLNGDGTEGAESTNANKEEVITIAEKFIRDKGLLSRDILLNLDEFTTDKGKSSVKFKYVLGNDDEDIKIRINNIKKSVITFEID